MPKLSVISGAYNIANLYSLEKSMNSVLSQSFTDFEFIICEDGSSDKSFEVLCAYAEKDSRIRILKNEKNSGLAFSLNRCIEVANGEYIARHDLDDYNDLTRFEKQIAFLDSHPDISVLGTAAYLFDETGVWGSETFPESIQSRDFLFNSPYKHGSVVFRKKALLEAGCYRVAKETRRAEDYDLFMTIQKFAGGANLKERLYYFCEDKNTLKRRKYRYRIDEVKVRWRGFKKLGLLPSGIFYVIKPLIVGLIPARMLRWLQKKLKRKQCEKERT